MKVEVIKKNNMMLKGIVKLYLNFYNYILRIKEKN